MVNHNSYSYAFTVFTPTFNRAHTLERVRQSLLSQTFMDFEWLIVDDGSTDSTPQLIDKWLDDSPFPIQYIRQLNSGKHVAFNRGVSQARGELFITLDSDDSCLPEALATLFKAWQDIPNAVRENFAAVTGLCVDENGQVVGERFPFEMLDSNPSELNHRYKIKGEKWGFTKTDLLKKHPYPEPAEVLFVPESVVWIPIGKKYQTRYVNQPLRIYHTANEDSLSHSGLKWSQVEGLFIWHQTVLNYEAGWIWRDPASILRSAVNYGRFGMLAGLGLARQAKGLNNMLARLLWLAGLAPGLILARRDRKLLGGKLGSLQKKT